MFPHTSMNNQSKQKQAKHRTNKQSFNACNHLVLWLVFENNLEKR